MKETKQTWTPFCHRKLVFKSDLSTSGLALQEIVLQVDNYKDSLLRADCVLLRDVYSAGPLGKLVHVSNVSLLPHCSQGTNSTELLCKFGVIHELHSLLVPKLLAGEAVNITEIIQTFLQSSTLKR